MRENLTHAIEDYLKTIYLLTREQDRATTNQLAERLNITPASVSGMVKKLANTTPPLVDYEKHRGVILTLDGEKVALEVVRHHRLLELFLHQILGYPWEKVHDEADRLEHVISEEFESRIAEALGDPLHDPHGDPIPTVDLHIPPTSSVPLSDLCQGETAIIQRVDDFDSELLSFLQDLGLTPRIQIDITQKSRFDKNITIRLENKEIVLGPPITDSIYVEIID